MVLAAEINKYNKEHTLNVEGELNHIKEPSGLVNRNH
jgi:hypothetical protein